MYPRVRDLAASAQASLPIILLWQAMLVGKLGDHRRKPTPMTTQKMTLVLEDTAINLSERVEDFGYSAAELATFNVGLVSQTAADVTVISVEGVRISSEIDHSQDGVWIATLNVALSVEAEPIFLSKVRAFDEVPELYHLKDTVLDAIADSIGLDFSGSWYMREMSPVPEHEVDATAFSM